MVQVSSADDGIVGKHLKQVFQSASAPEGSGGIKAGNIQQQAPGILSQGVGDGDTPLGEKLRGIPDGGGASGAVNWPLQHGNTSFLPDYAAKDVPVLDFSPGSGIIELIER